jgi:hypothetical protein
MDSVETTVALQCQNKKIRATCLVLLFYLTVQSVTSCPKILTLALGRGEVTERQHREYAC